MYTNIKNIRQLTGLTTDEISNADLEEIISQAIALINSKINVVTTEKIRYIDDIRKNNINAKNKLFYVSNSLNYYFGDLDNNGEINTSDIIVYLDRQGERTKLIPVSIDVEGSFVLSEAPIPGDKLTVKYAYTFYNVSTPDKLISLLTSYLSASYAFLQKEHGLSSETKFGNITIRTPVDRTNYSQYTNRFNELLKQINVPLNKPRTKEYKYLI